jgi:hypothetical protein
MKTALSIDTESLARAGVAAIAVVSTSSILIAGFPFTSEHQIPRRRGQKYG